VEIELQLFLTLALDGDEWSTLHCSHLRAGKRTPVPTE
jgi:hypothetical protein